MNKNAMACPTQQQLSDFSAGKLDLPRSTEIEQHLGDCPTCCQFLKMLPDDSTLVSLLRDPRVETRNESRHGPPPASEAATLPPVAERGTITPSDGVTEVTGASSGEAALPLPGPLLDHARYRVTQLLGSGGMGDVYKAHHRMMNRTVALKVINAQLVDSQPAIQRFHREVQAAARLAHPNIVTAYDAEQAGDAHFLVMEYVDGTDLAALVRERGPLPVPEACDYVRQAAEGLQHAHELGMVHRDIKPQNLMVQRSPHAQRDACNVVKILDFGLANFANEAAAEQAEQSAEVQPVSPLAAHLTALGSMMGTPDYISPEQASDAHSADIRSDIYSLGCTLYCLLTGEPPFTSDSVLEKVMAHVQSEARPLSDHRGDLPPGLDEVLRRMMAKDANERFQTPAEVAEALRPFAGAEKEAAAERELKEVGRAVLAPSDGIIATAILHLVPWVFVVAMGGVEAISGLAASLVLSLALIALPLIPLMIWGAVCMRRLRSRFLARVAATLAVIPLTPASLLGIPVGIWALAVLHRPRVKAAFESGTTLKRPAGGRLSDRPSRRLLAGAAAALLILAAIVVYVATDTGQVSVDATVQDAPDARIVLLRNGKQYATFELTPGTEPQAVRAGEYEVELRNASADVQMHVWTKRRGGNDWGAPDDHVKEPVFLYRGGRMLIGVTRVERPQHTMTDQDRLQGKWVPVSALIRGSELSAEQLARMSLTLNGNRAELTEPETGQTQSGTFTIDAGHSPKRIDFIAPDGKERMPGIFEFDGSRLKLAWVDGDYARPTGFQPAQTPDHMTAVFRHVPGSVPPAPRDARAAAAPLNETQREVVKAAEAFLVELDSGRFGAARDQMSSVAKRQTTREAFSTSMQALRDAFGRVTQRERRRVQVLDEPLPGMPVGRYAGVQYISDYEQKGGLWESLLLIVDQDGEWRVLSYGNTLQPLPFPGEDAVEQKNEKDAAEAAARQWLGLVDAGRYNEAWEACAELARKADSKQKLVRNYTRLFQSVGRLNARRLLVRAATNTMSGAPPGEYMVIRFRTRFTKQTVIETVVLTNEADGKWRVSGYFHAEDNESTHAQTSGEAKG